MSKRGGLYIGMALLLFALTGFIAAKAISPRRQIDPYEVSGEKFLQPTFTPVPTGTPPEPTASAGPLCTVLQDINFRIGPGTAYGPPLHTFTANTQLIPLAYNPVGIPGGSWVQVKEEGGSQIGWVSAGEQFVSCNIDLSSLPSVNLPPPPPTLTLTRTATPTRTGTPFKPTGTPAECTRPIGWQVYTLQPDDTLSRLSQELGISVNDLRKANCLSSTLIYAGRRLYVPRLPAIPTATPTLTRTPLSPRPTDTPRPTPLPNVLLEAEYPEKLETGRSDWVRITLFRTQQQTWIVTVESTEHVAELASPQPLGTIGAPIEAAFGSEYSACAMAILQGQGFEIGELTPGCQSLEQPKITWDWNIRPKSDALDRQIVNMRIEGRWQSEKTGSEVQRELFRTRFEVRVTRPVTGYINFGSIISGALGSVLSIPWLFDKVKDSRDKKRKQEEDKPKILLP